jgi:hypothetical protein
MSPVDVKMKTSHSILILLLTLFSAIALGTEVLSSPQAYLSTENVPWWNENWKYRWPINVTNTSTSSSYDYQVNVLLNFTNFDFTKAKADGSDLRFIYYNSPDETQNELNYWIETWNYTAWKASIWTKVPRKPTNDTITIYIYYGNPDAEGISNFDAVFQKLTADENTVALWHFDEGEGNKTLDASKYSNHGFIYNTTWDRDASFTSGSSLEFKGNNSYVEVLHSPSVDLVDAFTIEVWVKPHFLKSPQHAYDLANPIIVKVENYMFGIWNNSVRLLFKSVENGTRIYHADYNFSIDKWYHIAAVYTITDWTVRFYVDGFFVGSSTDPTPPQTPEPSTNPINIAQGSQMYVDEVRILSKALTAPEVKADYEHRKYVFPEPIISVKPLHPIELTVLEPKSTKIGGTVTFTIIVTSGYDRVIALSAKVRNNSQIISILNATKISETTWQTTEWDTTKHPEAIYQLQAEVLHISGNTLTINLTQIQVEQSTTFKILSSLTAMAIPILSIIIIAIPLALLLKGFKPKWFHFLFFPALFVTLMATYDLLKPTWENIFSQNPWASTTLTLSIVMAMFILWTTTLKEEKEVKLSRIQFTKHASEKFEVLEKYGFKISKDHVITAIRNPLRLEQRDEQFLAMKVFIQPK